MVARYLQQVLEYRQIHDLMCCLYPLVMGLDLMVGLQVPLVVQEY
jgi:hypothetical protein